MAENILLKKFREQYYDLPDFMKRTGCPVNKETVRLAIYEGKPISIPTLIIIAKYLEFSPAQIKEILKAAGDKEYYHLISTEKKAPPEWQRGLLDAVSKIKDKDPWKLNIIADQLELVGKAIGLDVSQHTLKLRIYKKTMRTNTKSIALKRRML